MNEGLRLGLIFLMGTALSFALVRLLRRKPRRPELRLEESVPETEPERPLVLGPWTEALSAQLPALPKTQIRIDKELRLAGYYQRTRLMEFRAVRTVLVLLPLLFTGLLALLVDEERTGTILIGGLLVTALCFSAPRLYLLGRARKRARDMERGLPLTIDLLILCLSAGQSLLEALRNVSGQLHSTHPVLAQELAITCQQAELHSLDYALTQWSDRVNLPEVTGLTLALIQSEKLGTDAAATLAELAVNYRTTTRQRAEAKANRVSFWLLLPSVFCFWIAAAIILVGPAYLEFIHNGKETLEKVMEQTRRNVQLANGRRPTPRVAPAARTADPR